MQIVFGTFRWILKATSESEYIYLHTFSIYKHTRNETQHMCLYVYLLLTFFEVLKQMINGPYSLWITNKVISVLNYFFFGCQTFFA